MQKFFILLLFSTVQIFAQINTQPKDVLVKDPYFNAPQNAQQGTKVRLIHSDFFQKTYVVFKN